MKLALLALIAGLSLSCKGNTDPTPTSQEMPLHAGAANTTMYFYVFSPQGKKTMVVRVPEGSTWLVIDHAISALDDQ